MKFWVIRRKSDGATIPYRVGKRGMTCAQPSITKPPRLFRLRSHAAAALTCWLDGRWMMSRSGGQNYFGECDYDEELRVEKDIDRKPEDFEVVQVKLIKIKEKS